MKKITIDTINPQITVGQLIEKLSKFPKKSKVFIRSKYSGETDPFVDYQLRGGGVNLMENKSVTFLF